jgi:dienelactone hydrolase
MRAVQFKSHGCSLRGYLFLPETWIAPQKLPCVCLVPGAYGLINRIKSRTTETGEQVPIPSAIDGLIDLSRALRANGFIVFAYDGRGMGGYHPQLPKSEGERREQKVSQEDVEAALDFLETIEAIDPSRIGAFGQSVGGAAIAFQAAEDKRLKSLVLWGTPPSYTECVKNGIIKLEKSGLGSASAFLDIEKVLPALKQPVLLAGGSDDSEFFNLDFQSRNLESLASSNNVFLLLVKGVEHRIDACYPSFSILVSLLTGWFRTTL